MKNRFPFIIACMITIFVLTACTSHEATTDQKSETNMDNRKEKETAQVDKRQEDANSEEKKEGQAEESKSQMEELPAIPFSLEEAANYPKVGQFAGEEYKEQQEIEDVLEQFPRLAKDSSAAEIEHGKRYLFSLFQENMTEVDVPIEQWESMTFSDPTGDSDEIKAKENYNVALLLDASGSMKNYEHDRTRMDLAKEAIQQFVENLPDTANVSLYVYGHVGSGSDADKAKSCAAIDEVYPLSNYNKDEFSTALNQFEPAGWTPMARAIKQVHKDFKKLDAKQNANMIYIVSDGIETCDEDPVKAIKSLADSKIDPVINIIGYQVDNEGLKQLKEMAAASKGRYVNAASQADILAEFEQTSDMAGLWADWHNDAQRDISNLFNTISKKLADWNNGEQRKLSRQTNNLFRAVSYLRDQEIIDSDVYSEFMGEITDSNSAIGKEITEIYQELNTTNIDELEKNRKDIIERYQNRDK